MLMHPRDRINKIKYDDKKQCMVETQLKIFFDKAKKIKHPVTYRYLMQVLFLE